MTRTSHLASGAILVSGFVWSHYLGDIWSDLSTTVLVATCIALFVGATAPDWLEIPRFSRTLNRRISLIPHRTITHWPVLWLGLFAYAYWDYGVSGEQINFILMGFAIGGLVHLLLDLMTPAGIPVVMPFVMRNRSIYLVRSVFGEGMTLILMLVATFFLVSQYEGIASYAEFYMQFFMRERSL